MITTLITLALVLSPTLGRPQEPAPASPQAPAPAAPQASPQQGGSTPIPIISQSDETKEDGGFSYSFETGNGIKVQETGTLKQGAPGLQGRSAAGGDEDSNNTVVVLQGSFSYTAPDGQLISLKYVADENGFQPEGEHLPTPPPGLQDALNALKQGGSPQQADQPQQAQPQQQATPQQAQPQQPQEQQQSTPQPQDDNQTPQSPSS